MPDAGSDSRSGFLARVLGILRQPASPDANGWYNHALPITFEGTDTTSGVESCTPSTYGGPDARAVTVNGSCTDVAGNTSNVSFGPFDYDGTPATTTIDGGGLQTLSTGSNLVGGAADHLSGVASTSVTFASLGGNETRQATCTSGCGTTAARWSVALTGLSGIYTVTASSIDKCRNAGTELPDDDGDDPLNALSPASRSQSAVPGAERRRLRTIGVIRLVEGVLLAGVALMGMVFLLRAGGSGIFDAIATTDEALWRRVIAGWLPPFGVAAVGIGLVGVALVVLDAALTLGGRRRPGRVLQALIGALVIAGLFLTVVTEARYQAELKPWPALTRQVEAFRPPAGARLVQTRNEGPETGASLPSVVRVWVVQSTVDRICEDPLRSFGTWADRGTVNAVDGNAVRAIGLFCAADGLRGGHGVTIGAGPTLNAALDGAIGPPIEIDRETEQVDVYVSVRIQVSLQER